MHYLLLPRVSVVYTSSNKKNKQVVNIKVGNHGRVFFNDMCTHFLFLMLLLFFFNIYSYSLIGNKCIAKLGNELVS